MKNGFLLVNKKEGVTTNSINNLVKKRLNVSKVGHLGTLDPFACGLVIIAINEATKFLPYVDDDYKCYIATIKLGEETSTFDNTSEIINNMKVRSYSNIEIINVLKSFLSKSKQTPPKYSAKSINGVRAYDLARKNIDFKLKEIEIEIKEIELINYDRNNNTITFSALVSKGTYIRTLGIDIAKKLNTIGHLIYLNRDSIGRYKLDNAINEEDINIKRIIKIEDFFLFDKYNINDNEYKKVSNGNCLKLNSDKDKLLIFYKSELIALYSKNDNIYLCERKLNI